MKGITVNLFILFCLFASVQLTTRIARQSEGRHTNVPGALRHRRSAVIPTFERRNCFNASCDGNQFRFDYRFEQEAEGWFKLHQVPATWNNAWLKCFREGAVLASPEDAHMLAVMMRLTSAARSRGVFTGIHATFSQGDYHTIEGTPLSKLLVSWAPDEPDNFENSEDCIIMVSDGTLVDVPCGDVYPFLCFKKKTKNMFAGGTCGTVDSDYALDARTGSCYKFHRLPQTWNRAFAACAGEGGHLAIINSNEEAQVIKELYAKNPSSSLPGKFEKDSSHIGHCDWGERGLWLTIHGQTLKDAGYNNWGSTEPANRTKNNMGQYCGAVTRSGTLNDLWCNLPAPFICEKAPCSLLDEDQS